MGRAYSHLSYEQRMIIKEALDSGVKKSAIAARLGIHPATVYREIERGTVNGRYEPDYAERTYRKHLLEKGAPSILSVSPELAEHIAGLILNENMSPAEIVEVLQHDERWPAVPKSQGTIYSAIDSGLIPGVTRESLRSNTTTMFNDGQVHLARWVRNALKIQDGDELSFEVSDDRIILRKADKA